MNGRSMKEIKRELIGYCKKFEGAYEDYPFRDENMTVMRCASNKKIFAFIFPRGENIWINVKCSPQWIDFWRNTYPSVIPGYHMNKKHWNSIIVDGTVPKAEIMRMIGESYDLVK